MKLNDENDLFMFNMTWRTSKKSKYNKNIVNIRA